MTALEFGNIVFSFRGAAIVVALLSVVQISPLKINPWSWIGRAVGRGINGEVIQKVDKLDEEIQDIRDEMGVDRAVQARVRILRFNDELLENKRHSKDSFDQCLADIDNYERYCDTHREFKNNMTVMAANNIKRCYDNCLKQHDFL